MKCYFDDFMQQLQNQKSVLAPVYIVSGDEPLQSGEACDALRARARQEGYSEREVMHVEKSFDWDQLLAASQSLSLFGDRRLIELRMPTGKPGDKGAKALRDYADNLPQDTILLIISGKIEKQAQSSKWYSALEKNGVALQVWPIEQKQLPAWISKRMRAKGLQPSATAVSVLVDRVEGNLLAAAQEIEKLCLLHGEGPVSEDDVTDCVTDSSRFDVYGLVDVVLAGDVVRLHHMIERLRGEGAEPVLMLWAMTREIRTLELMAQQVSKGVRPEQVVAAARVWPKRVPVVTAAIKRHPAQRWQAFLQLTARIDRMVKGQETGNVWDELVQLCLLMAGIRLFSVSRLAV